MAKKIKNKEKTLGETLFDSYDTCNTGRKINNRYERISTEYPARQWHELSDGERKRWEWVALHPVKGEIGV